MSLPFTIDEYRSRLAKVRGHMDEKGIELLLIADPANMNYLTGYDSWSFYVPQVVAVPRDPSDRPLWIGRQMDTAQAPLTSWLPAGYVVGYPEIYIQTRDSHPMDWIAGYLLNRGWDKRRIGIESDTYYLSPKALDRLRAGLPNSMFVDADLLVNWIRSVKSETELAYMRSASRLAERVMQVAIDTIAPGVRQCDAMAAIMATQIGGSAEFAGSPTALVPLLMSGRAAAAPHPVWTNERFKSDQTTCLELGASCHRYHAAIARTLQWGKPPKKLVNTTKIVEEGLEAALATIKSGIAAGDVEAAWRRVLDRNGLKKESRIGYAIGLGYPPDWGEHTISLRAGETTILEADTTIHVMLGMWMDDWGMEMSETVRVTRTGVECLTHFPRGLEVRT